MKKEKILGKLNGDSEEDIEKDVLDSFGFRYISSIGSRNDGSIIVDAVITEREGKDCELWIDYVGERTLIYKYGDDLYFIDGELTKEEEEKYYN